MMIRSATNATTTTTTATLAIPISPPLLPIPKVLPVKPMPSSRQMFCRQRYPKKKNSTAKERGSKKGTRTRRCAVRGPTRPAAHPSPNNDNNWYIPTQSFQKRPKRQPSRSRKKGQEKVPTTMSPCLLRARRCNSQKPGQWSKGRRKGIHDVDVGNHICNAEEGTGFPIVPSSSSLLSIMVIVSGTSVFFFIWIGFPLMRQPPRPLPK
jgi:hypothetical protein